MIPSLLLEDSQKILRNSDDMSLIVNSANITNSSSPFFKHIFKRSTNMKFHLGFIKKTDTSNIKSVRPSPAEALNWSNSFTDLMASKYGLALFRAFLQRDYCDENIEFWLAVEEYRKLKPSKLVTKSRQILGEFILPQSPKEINLDSLTRDALVNKLQNSPPTSSTFDQVQKRTQNVLEADAYARFLQSKLYQELVHPERFQEI